MGTGRRWTHVHSIQIQDRISDQLAGPMIRHLPAAHCDEEVGTDVLHLFLLGVELVQIGRIVPPASGIRRCVL